MTRFSYMEINNSFHTQVVSLIIYFLVITCIPAFDMLKILKFLGNYFSKIGHLSFVVHT